MQEFKLCEENYFSSAMEWQYCGSSQFKRFCECPAKAMAMLKGEWVEEKTSSKAIGSYVDAYISNTLEIFKENYPDWFTQKGELKSLADIKKAQYIVERIENDELFKKYISGDHQTIMTGEIEGLKFKIKADSFFKDKNVCTDLKVVKDFEFIWNNKTGRKENFVEYWHYDWQAAIYSEIIRQNTGILPKYFIAAITKEKYSDLVLLNVSEQDLLIQLEIVKSMIPYVKAIKEGKAEATRCEHCDYCKSTKKLTQIINYRDLGNI